MPKPTPDWDLVTLTGKLTGTNAKPVTGRIKFRPRATRLKDLDQLTDIISREVIVTLVPVVTDEETGAGYSTFSVDLPATDDPDITPNGFTYQVTEEFAGGGGLKFDIEVPLSAAADGLDYTLLSDDGLVQPGTPSYVAEVLQARVDALAAAQEAADSATAADSSAQGAAGSASAAADSETAAAGSAGAASDSATAAAGSAGDAADSASAAAGSAGAANDSASDAAGSAGAAATSESNASDSEAAAAQSATEAEGHAQSAAGSVSLVAWAPATMYAAGDVRQAPDGSTIRRLANGASGAVFDAAEEAAWESVLSIPTTIAGKALSASYVGKDGDEAVIGASGYEARIYSEGGNTGFGYYAGGAPGVAIDATTSTALGHGAGLSMAGASGATLIGYAAGGHVTDAVEVTHVGSYAGWYASGDGNTSLGSRAMCGPNGNVPAMTGEKNTFVGVEAGATISTGSRNTGLGWEAGGGAGNYVPITNITVAGTTVTVTCADTGTLAVGMPLLISSVVGFTANSPNGYGRVVTAITDATHFTYTQSPAPTGTYTSGGTWLGGSVTGNDNTWIGHLAGFNNQRGSANVGAGSNVLQNLENGSANAVVGTSAMNLSTTAHDNAVLGHQAAFGLTTGSESVYIGREAGYTDTPANKSTTAGGQTFVGYQSGQGDTVQGVYVTGIGRGTKTKGHYGTALGALALADGHYAMALGKGAVATGQGAVAIGVDSGGVAAQATAWDDFVLGTATHQVRTPGRLTTAAPTATQAGLVLPHGTAPTTPNNGAIWSTTAGLFVRINGVTKTVTLT